MGIGRASALVLAAVALLCPAVLASGFGVVGVGGEASGMGGAFRAVADNWTAAFYNPAGYAGINDNTLGGDYILVHWRNEITPDYRWDDTFETGIINDVPSYNRHDVFGNGGAGLVLRIPAFGETVLGLSIFQEYDYNVHWQLFDEILAYNNLLTVPGNQFENNFDIVSFQLTAAREYSEKLWLGIGVEVLRGDLLMSNINFRTNPYLEIDPDWAGANRPFDKILQWSQNDGRGFSLGFRFGALWNGSENFRVGVTAHLPLSMTIKGDALVNYYMPKLEAPLGSGSDPLNLLTNGSMVSDSADFETEINLPATLGFGLAYDVTEKLTVAADVEFTMWSTFEGFAFDYSNHRGITGSADTASVLLGSEADTTRSYYLREFFTADQSYPIEWDNTLKFMFGARYMLSETLDLLGGVSFDGSAVSNDLQTPLAMDLGDKLGLNGGLTVHIDQWDLTLSTSYVKHPDADVTTMTDLDGDGMVDSFAGSYKAETYQTILSFNYRF